MPAKPSTTAPPGAGFFQLFTELPQPLLVRQKIIDVLLQFDRTVLQGIDQSFLFQLRQAQLVDKQAHFTNGLTGGLPDLFKDRAAVFQVLIFNLHQANFRESHQPIQGLGDRIM